MTSPSRRIWLICGPDSNRFRREAGRIIFRYAEPGRYAAEPRRGPSRQFGVPLSALIAISTVPAPTPANPGSQLKPGPMVHSLLGGLWAGISSSPWTIVGAVAFCALVVIRAVQAVKYPRHRRDPLRRFSHVQKQEILARAAHRCEYHGWLTGRCTVTAGLEADHVVPWSRSGPTTVENGQALCRRHNRSKAATVPFGWQRRAIDRRRLRY